MSHPLSHLAELVATCQEELTGTLATRTFHLSDSKDGVIRLGDESERAFEATAARLLSEFGKKDDLSPRLIKALLTNCLFRALDLQHESPLSPERRVRKAIEDLRKQLTADRKQFTCYIPVSGAIAKDLPISFGNIRLIRSGQSREHKLVRHTNSKQFRKIIRRLNELDVWKEPYAVVTVSAHDADAAQLLAKAEIRTALDCMNFLGEFIPYNHARLHFPSEGARTLEAGAITCDDGYISLPHEAKGGLGAFRFDNIATSPRTRKYWQIVSRMLRNRKPGTGGDTLSGAIQWAGRASVDPRREQSFLLYAIALESAVLPTKGSELNYRMGLRVSRLLARSRSERSALMALVGDLYAIRSKIVHSGSFKVTDKDLEQINSLTKRVLLRLLERRRFANGPVAKLEEMLESLGRG